MRTFIVIEADNTLVSVLRILPKVESSATVIRYRSSGGMGVDAEDLELNQPAEMERHEMATPESCVLFGPWEIDGGQECVYA